MCSRCLIKSWLQFLNKNDDFYLKSQKEIPGWHKPETLVNNLYGIRSNCQVPKWFVSWNPMLRANYFRLNWIAKFRQNTKLGCLQTLLWKNQSTYLGKVRSDQVMVRFLICPIFLRILSRYHACIAIKFLQKFVACLSIRMSDSESNCDWLASRSKL